MPEIDLSPLTKTTGGNPDLRGYLAKPSGSGSWPGVVMIHEAFGLTDIMRGMADHLATLGYLTVAPDLFGVGQRFRCLVATMRTFRSGRGRAIHDIGAARRWLEKSPECTGRVGVIGFCMGGGFALLTANSGFAVAAPNYGMLPKNLEETLDGACPVVASYGGRDRSLPHAAEKLDAALTLLGIEHDVHEYPDAGHAFFDPENPAPAALRPMMRVMGVRHDARASKDAWQRIDAYFTRFLREEPSAAPVPHT